MSAHAFTGMLSDVINAEFLKSVGKFQMKTTAGDGKGKALRIQFRTRVDMSKEDGYRSIELLLYAPANYVGVYSRESWDVIDRENLEYDEDLDEDLPKKGMKYTKGKSEWICHMYHDSGWRHAVEDFLRKNADKIEGFQKMDWFEVVSDVTKYNLPSG